MAKPENETDRMKISFDVGLAEAGYMIAMLTKAGMTNVKYEVTTEVRTYGTNKQYAEKGVDIVLRVLADGKEHATQEIAQAFEAAGRPKQSASTALYATMDKKLVKKIGPATWQLADAAQKATVGAAAAAHGVEAPKVIRKRFEEPGRIVLARIITDGKAHSTDELKKVFVEQGRNPDSVSPNMDNFLKRKLIKRVEKGVYQMIESPVAKATLGKMTAPAVAKVNGAAAHA